MQPSIFQTPKQKTSKIIPSFPIQIPSNHCHSSLPSTINIKSSHVQILIQPMSKRILLLFLFIFSSVCLFKDDSAVFKLTAKNFQSTVLDSDQFWLVQFYAPWCGHCKRSAPQFEKAAEILDGIVRVGAVNMDEERKAGEPYNVQGYPTIKFFGNNKKSPLAFESNERTFDKFVEYCVQQMKSEIKKRSTSEQL